MAKVIQGVEYVQRPATMSLVSRAAHAEVVVGTKLYNTLARLTWGDSDRALGSSWEHARTIRPFSVLGKVGLNYKTIRHAANAMHRNYKGEGSIYHHRHSLTRHVFFVDQGSGQEEHD